MSTVPGGALNAAAPGATQLGSAVRVSQQAPGSIFPYKQSRPAVRAQSSMDLRDDRSDLSEDGETDPDFERWRLFRPFPRQTSTLVAGPSFLGKSTYVRKLIEYQHLFFQDRVSRVVVVNCNDAVTFCPLEEPKDDSPFRRPLAELVQRTWEDFELEELDTGDVLVIDDLQRVTERVREIVTAATHHLALGHCFLICHSVLGSKQYELLNLVHRIALFCSSTSVANLASYVLSTRILDPELKVQLKQALGAAQRSREVLVLELSSLPESIQPYHVASSHLLRLLEPKSGFALVYPYPARAEMFQEFSESFEDVEPRSREEAAKNLPGPEEFVAGSFLVLRPEQVASLKKRAKSARKAGDKQEEEDLAAEAEAGKCLDKREEEWNSTVLRMERDLENFLPAKQWRAAKSLLYEILHSPKMCLLHDGRRIKLHGNGGAVASAVDFISTATRRDAPAEKRSKGQTLEYKNYRQFTSALLSAHAPRTIFKNRLVLPGPAEARRATEGTVKGKKKQKKRRKKKKRRRMLLSQPRTSEDDSLSTDAESVELADLDFSVPN